MDKMDKNKKVSMQIIADELGISKVTVSKALNGKEGVGEELKKKIFETAGRYQYTLPDYGQRKAKKVGVIMHNRFTSLPEIGKFYMSMYEKIQEELRKSFCTCIMLTPHRESVVRDLQTIEQSGMFDGIILLGILDTEVRKKVDSIQLPKVYVDVYDESLTWDSVVMESVYSTYELTRYLMEMGHKEIGFVGTIGATTSITDRYLGYMRALIERGIHLNEDWVISDRTQEGAPLDLVLPEQLPTSFVCNCDETALRLVKVLQKKGIKVPEDISVVSFDNDIYAELCEPTLTTVAVNVKEIGKVTAKRMIRHMAEPEKGGGEVYRVPGKIIYRESVKKMI